MEWEYYDLIIYNYLLNDKHILILNKLRDIQ